MIPKEPASIFVYRKKWIPNLLHNKNIIETLFAKGFNKKLKKDGAVMNKEMAYLLGMICGNGQIRRGVSDTTISIEIPHKKLKTENNNDVRIYVRASITDIRSVLEPLLGTGLAFMQQDKYSILYFTKSNDEYLMREILRYIGHAVSHEDIRIDPEIFTFTRDEKLSFLQGFADVTGYIRRSNYYFQKYMHRVYLEVPHNWYLVTDICRLLQDVNIPVQNIDWAHPNMRDGKLVKYNEGKPDFGKKNIRLRYGPTNFFQSVLPLSIKKKRSRNSQMN